MNQSLNNTAVVTSGCLRDCHYRPNLQHTQIPSTHVEFYVTLDFRLKCSLFVLLCFVCFPCPENLIGFVSSAESEWKQVRNCDRRLARFGATNYVLAIRVYIVLNWLPVDDMPSFRDIYLSKKNVILPLNTKPLFVILRCERKHCSARVLSCYSTTARLNTWSQWRCKIRFPFQLIKSSVNILF